jgi:hypothetical protein
METKMFAIKIPEIEKNAMDYISKEMENPLSKLFYKPIQDAIYSNLGLVLLYKIDLRNAKQLSKVYTELFQQKTSFGQSIPIIEDFIGLILNKHLKSDFWKIFGDIQLNEKDFLLNEIDIFELSNYMGREYLLKYGNFQKIDLDYARNLFFNYMLITYFNTTALGSINKLNQEWNNHQPLIKQYQGQMIARYLNKYQPKKLEAIKVDELMEVSEYIE